MAKDKIYKLDFIQIKNSFAKDTIKKMTRPTTQWENSSVLVCGFSSETHFDYSNDSFHTAILQSPQASLLHKRRLYEKAGKENAFV